MGNLVNKKSIKYNSYLIKSFEDHRGGINCMDISNDFALLASGSDDNSVIVWNIKNDSFECIGKMDGHKDYITCVLIEENFVLSSSADSTMKKWDIGTCECVLTFKGHESTINKIICTGDFIFTISYDKTAMMWDFDTGDCVRVFRGHKNNITSLLFVPSDREQLEAALDFIKLHAEKNNLELKDRQVLPGISGHSQKRQSKETNFVGGDTEIDETEIYAKDIIITGSLDNSARSWSIETGECVHTFRGHTSGITCMALDPLGKLLFTGSADHDIRSWEIMTGQLLKIFIGHQTTVLSLLAHRKLLYSTSSDHTARCWVMEFGDCTRVYKDHLHTVGCLVENEGLGLIAFFTGCGDGIVRCFDGKSGALKRTFIGHSGAINCLKVINDRLFTGSFDGTIKIFDTSNLTCDKEDPIDFSNENNNDYYTEDIEDY